MKNEIVLSEKIKIEIPKKLIQTFQNYLNSHPEIVFNNVHEFMESLLYKKALDLGFLKESELKKMKIEIEISEAAHKFFELRAHFKNKTIEQEIADFIEKESKTLQELDFQDAIT